MAHSQYDPTARDELHTIYPSTAWPVRLIKCGILPMDKEQLALFGLDQQRLVLARETALEISQLYQTDVTIETLAHWIDEQVVKWIVEEWSCEYNYGTREWVHVGS